MHIESLREQATSLGLAHHIGVEKNQFGIEEDQKNGKNGNKLRKADKNAGKKFYPYRDLKKEMNEKKRMQVKSKFTVVINKRSN
jgi:hypothetical protein